MDFKHKFSKESKQDLLEFLKVATEQKQNQFCDMEKYYCYRTTFKLDQNLKGELSEYILKPTVCEEIIEIVDDNEENQIQEELLKIASQEIEVGEIENNNQTTVDDITCAIKENLEEEKCLSILILNDLILCSSDKLDNLFNLLSKELNTEAVINFGTSLKSVECKNEFVIIYFIRYLLINKLLLEYSDKLQETFSDFFYKHPTELTSELAIFLLNTNESSKVLLQFLDHANNDCKSTLLKNFLCNCNRLHENYISILEILLTNQTEYDTLDKLTQIMSNVATDYASDKSFGKLLLNVIQMLGKNVLHLEKPLKHIIGSHSSIWKSKVQKCFNSLFEDSFIMSQSLK